MKAPILLHIPEPCHENWDAMTPQDKGRHCQSCNKVVVDFSVMSDRQVLDYFKNAQGNTCGRFHNDQLQRPLIEPQKQPSKWNYFVASVVSFFIGVKSFGQAKLQGKVAFPTQQTTTQANELQLTKGEVSAPTLITVSGKVVDEKGVAIPDASIQIKGTKLGTTSKADGSFELNKLGSNIKLTIVVSSLGYETKTIEVESKDLKNSLVVSLNNQSQNLEELIINSDYGHHKKGSYRMVCNVKINKSIARDTIIKPIQKILDIEPVKIYPNPIVKNTNVHIAIKQTGTWELQLFNTQSNLLSVKEVIINTSNQVIAYTLPNNIASGNYFIRLINKESKKIITEQIIVL